MLSSICYHFLSFLKIWLILLLHIFIPYMKSPRVVTQNLYNIIKLEQASRDVNVKLDNIALMFTIKRIR